MTKSMELPGDPRQGRISVRNLALNHLRPAGHLHRGAGVRSPFQVGICPEACSPRFRERGMKPEEAESQGDHESLPSPWGSSRRLGPSAEMRSHVSEPSLAEGNRLWGYAKENWLQTNRKYRREEEISQSISSHSLPPRRQKEQGWIRIVVTLATVKKLSHVVLCPRKCPSSFERRKLATHR